MKDKINRKGVIISLVIEVIGGILFFVAFASPDWVVIDDPPQKYGIWQACHYHDSNINCTSFEKSPYLAEVWKGFESKLGFVLTVRVFSIITGMLFMTAIVFYALCLYTYSAWFVAMATGFQFFGGMMMLTACLEWLNDYHEVGDSLIWAFPLAIISGVVFALNGIIYALIVCSGAGMVKHHFQHGITFRGEADRQIRQELQCKKA